VLGLADAGHVNPAAASERGANYLDRARYGRDVQTAAKRAEFLKGYIKEFADLAAGVADRGFARFRVGMRTGQSKRFAIQLKNFLAHFESGRKRAEPDDADRSRRVRQSSDLFPSEAEMQSREHSRQERIARAGRIDLLDLECRHSDRGIARRD